MFGICTRLGDVLQPSKEYKYGEKIDGTEDP